MTPRIDEIVDEIRRHREAHAASLDYDMKKITQDFQRQERDPTREVVTRQPRKPVTTLGRTSV
jgi:hypothetical protein